MLHRTDTLPYTPSNFNENRFDIGKIFPFDQHPQKYDNGEEPDDYSSNDVAGDSFSVGVVRGMKKSINKVRIKARLNGKRNRKDRQESDRINDPFKNNRPDQFVGRN